MSGDEGQDDGVEDLLERVARNGLQCPGQFNANEVEGQRPDTRAKRCKINLAASCSPRPGLVETAGRSGPSLRRAARERSPSLE
jgi:hypothetical protein